MKIVWYTHDFGRVYVGNMFVGLVHKYKDGSVTLDQASINRVKPSALPTL